MNTDEKIVALQAETERYKREYVDKQLLPQAIIETNALLASLVPAPSAGI
jgi:hypothetical protein